MRWVIGQTSDFMNDSEIREIQRLAHELIEIQSVNKVCENLLVRTAEIIEKQKSRIEEYGKRLDDITAHTNICLRDCDNRRKFPPKDPKDHGSWPS